MTILLKWLGKKDASRGVIYSHGLVAAISLVLLIVYAVQNPENFPKVRIALFVVSSRGFYMFLRDLSKKINSIMVAMRW